MKCKYRARWFSSKGAFLVLLWTLLTFSSFIFMLHTVASIFYLPDDSFNQTEWLFSFVILVGLSSFPLSGWLADAKFGNYKVFIVGAVLLFISAVMNCLFMILEELVSERDNVLKWVHLCSVSLLSVVGGCACMATALPLGLDQMPGASSANITSYIAWFVCSFFISSLLMEVLSLLKRYCLDEHIKSSFSLVLALFYSLCIGLILISNFFLSQKWLIIEPKSPQSLKNIYRVLKFAAKHKVPLNRSALTYWEENMPSRMDLGKSKYGGPFTTEQVEDVKTFLRLLIISLPSIFVLFSVFYRINIVNQPDKLFHNLTVCNTYTTTFFVSSSSLNGTLGAVAYELAIYPFIRNRVPSILKRICTVPMIMALVCFVCFVLKLTNYLCDSNKAATEWTAHVIYHSANGLLSQVLLSSFLEFMCAQSPYNMKGLLLSSAVLLLSLSGTAGWIFGSFHRFGLCKQSWCSQLIPSSVKTVLCLIGFLFFCVVTRWYKMRVRDEDYSPQRVVEEVYDRYLTAAAAQSRSYGTSN